MPRFGHTENGYAMDCQDATDVEEYLARFNSEITAGWTVQTVDNDSVDGATPKEGRGWSNPTAQAPLTVPVQMAGKEFHEYCATVLGTVNSNGPVAGMTRMGVIVRDMRNAGPLVNGLVEIAYQRYTAASQPGGKFTYADLPPLVQALATASLCTAEEAAGLANPSSWPRRPA
jgi:hypothetical protein